MGYLIQYDQWCLSLVRATLLWLEEWLSLSQSKIERLMIFIYLVMGITQTDGKSWILILLAFIILTMWQMHRTPDIRRIVRELYSATYILRTILQIWTVLGIAIDLCIPPMNTGSVLAAIRLMDYTLFIYVASISTKGDPGRRRKLAWNKIKELFGTEWIPKPIHVPS